MALLTETYISDASNCGSYFTSSQYTQPSICIYQANTKADFDGQTKYGVLYNYCAATGGTVCDTAAMSADAAGSVCPAGWKLPGIDGNPTGSGTSTGAKTYNDMLNGYSVTNNAAGFTKITVSPLSFVRSGNAVNGSLYGRSATGGGYYWSSSKYTSSNYAYILRFSSSNVIRDYYNRFYGYSVRCVSS